MSAGHGPHRAQNGIAVALLALVAYVPLLRTAPGWVGADTKHYLYLNPGKLMARAASVWDPSIGLGTVSHQNIGYLWPMGPWYWLFETVGAPDWVAQRLWLASVLFAAGAGTYVLLRLLGVGALGAATGAFAYQLSPYVLTYAARITAILLPWAGLPWLLVFTILALRRGGWRWPAAIALLVTTIGSINASSLLYAAIAAALWVPFAVLRLGDTTPRDATKTVLRIGLLCGVTQLWWLVALVLSGTYGPPVLQTTETLSAVSASSVSSEVVRSLGNWFFYGTDAVGPWVSAAVGYQTEVWLIAATFAVPLAALVSASFVRWTHRGYFLLVGAVGATIAVAAHPYDHPSPLGALTKLAADSSTLALGLRNAQRATPLLCLALAALLAAGVHELGSRVHRGDVLAAVGVTAVVAASLPALWSGGLVDRNLRRPEDIPQWNERAASLLDARPDGTRVLELPGTDFAAYRWGNTIDPLLPGLLERSWVGRESAPQGTAGSISLVTALDRRLQEGVLDPEAVLPVARLASAGDVVVRGDLQTERYRTPRPMVLRELVRSLRAPGATELGGAVSNDPDPALPLVDEIALGLPPGARDAAPLTLLPVDRARRIVSVVSRDAPVVEIAGDGEGIVEAASAGLIDGTELVRYAGDGADDEGPLVVTDTNRRRAHRFTQLRENSGYTETAGERALRKDEADARVDLFPDEGDDGRTVTELRGAHTINATGYGNTITNIPEERPALAFDGDASTAWKVGAFESPVGHRIRIDFGRSVPIEQLTLVQPRTGDVSRWITRVTVTAGGRSTAVALGPASRTPEGQLIELDAALRGRVVEVRIDADNVGRRPDYVGLGAVGFAEIAIPGVRVEEVVRPPVVGERLLDRDLTFVFARHRANSAEPVRADPERAMARVVHLRDARRFGVVASVRVSAHAADDVVDRLLGIADGPTATSSSRLPGSLAARASSAIDGDPATAWTPAFLAPDPSIDVRAPTPIAFDRLDLQLVDDGRHSMPRRVRIEAGGEERTVDVPRGGGAVTFPALRGDHVRVTFPHVDARTTTDYFTRAPIALPIAVAELGIPGVRRSAPREHVSPSCRTDLLEIDGRPVGLRIAGTTAAAERRDSLAAIACEADAALDAGRHVLRTAPGAQAGLDVDRVVLRSSAGGGPGDPRAPLLAGATHAAGPAARVDAERTSRSSHRVEVGPTERPAWLVLGESHSTGWRATVDGDDLGEPVRVNGYANAWRLPASADARVVELRWAPQRLVTAALAVSALAALACLVLIALNPRSGSSRGAMAPSIRPRTKWGGAAAVAFVVGAAAVSALVAGPALAPIGAALALAAARQRRALVHATAIIACAICAVGTIALQLRHAYPAGFTWAANLDRLHPVGWVVILATGVAAVEALVVADPQRNTAEES